MIISAWWLRTSSKFSGKKCGFVQNIAPPSLSRDRRIKMEQTNKQYYTCNHTCLNLWTDDLFRHILLLSGLGETGTTSSNNLSIAIRYEIILYRSVHIVYYVFVLLGHGVNGGPISRWPTRLFSLNYHGGEQLATFWFVLSGLHGK